MIARRINTFQQLGTVEQYSYKLVGGILFIFNFSRTYCSFDKKAYMGMLDSSKYAN